MSVDEITIDDYVNTLDDSSYAIFAMYESGMPLDDIIMESEMMGGPIGIQLGELLMNIETVLNMAGPSGD